MRKQWVLYILQLSNGAFYTGITNKLEFRLSMHRRGKGSRYVRSHLPFELVYTENCNDRSDASKKEAKIKKLTHKQKLEIINNS